MYIRYKSCGDPGLIYLPDTCSWSINLAHETPKGYVDCYVYLSIGNSNRLATENMGNQIIILDDSDAWLEGGSNITETEIENMYCEIIDIITKKVTTNISLNFIDMMSGSKASF